MFRNTLRLWNCVCGIFHQKILFVLLCFGFVIIFSRYFILIFTISIFVFYTFTERSLESWVFREARTEPTNWNESKVQGNKLLEPYNDDYNAMQHYEQWKWQLCFITMVWLLSSSGNCVMWCKRWAAADQMVRGGWCGTSWAGHTAQTIADPSCLTQSPKQTQSS